MINGIKRLRQIKKNTKDRLSFFKSIYDIIYKKSGSMGGGVVLSESKLLRRKIIGMGNNMGKIVYTLSFREP